MTSFQSNKSELVTSKDQLIAVLSGGSKPKDQWRLGTEHEKFSYRSSDFSPLPYGGPNGIQALLNGLRRFGWQGVYEGENIIALSQKDKGSVSLEPGGQVELSGAPLDNVHQTCTEVTDHLKHVKTVGDELGIGMLGLGFTPNWRRDDIHWMPKGRYKIMREYMPKVGSMGIDMMTRTCTVQINLDYSSEADMVKKLRVSLALQPLATALWANSPFTESKPNGFLSFRGNIWRDTDKARTGLIPFAFEDGMGFERYVDYILDVPMYFVYRDGFIDASGQSFRDFLKGKLPAYPGQLPTVADWEDHMSTAFPDVRVKSYIELRGADSGPWDSLCALPAFWVGLLYDSVALDATADIVKDWTAEDRAKLRDDVLTLALKAKIHGRSLQEIALQLLEAAGMDETGFLVPLQEIASSGITPAERMLASYHGSWKGDVTKAYAEYSY